MIGVPEIHGLRDMLLSVALALPRMLVCMLLIPVFAAGVLTRILRIAVAIAFTLPVSYGIAHSTVEIGGPVTVVVLILKESFIGIFLGFALAAPFWAIESVGALLDNQRGANAGQLHTPFGLADASLIGTALQQALIAFLAVTGGLTAMYQLFITSYHAWPVLALAPDFSGMTVANAVVNFSELARLTLLYALPLLAITLLVDFCFSMVGLFATQLQVYFAAMPVKSIAGIFILLLYLGLLIEHGENYFYKSIDNQNAIFENTIDR